MPFSLRQRWYATGLFFLVATGLSLLFRGRQPTWLAGWQLPYGYGLSLLVGVGPWLAAQFTRGVLRLPADRLCLACWGPSPVRSALFAVLPVLVLLVLGIPNHQAMPPALVAAQVSAWWAGYILGEEAGWRGFLQQVVPGNRLGKAAVVGTQWYLWHLSVVFETYSLSKELFFLAVLLVGSYVALLVTGRTRSWLPAVGLHFAFSVLTNVPTAPHYAAGIGALGLGWAGLLVTWHWGRPAAGPLAGQDPNGSSPGATALPITG